MKFDLLENFLVSTALFLYPVFSAKGKYIILCNFTGGSNNREKFDIPTLVPPCSENYGAASYEAMATGGTFFEINTNLNGDCKVDFQDFAVLADQWLDCGLEPPSACNQ